MCCSVLQRVAVSASTPAGSILGASTAPAFGAATLSAVSRQGQCAALCL